MTIRLHVDRTLVEHDEFDLPEAAARHAQVRRVQPGDGLRLFDGRGAERLAQVLSMGRKAVLVRLGPAVEPLPEPALRVTLALGMPANERMDTLVEKATELGVAVIQPLECERSVLRLSGERAQRKCEHWQAVAAAASEQSGRAVVPVVAPVARLSAWLAAIGPPRGALQEAADALGEGRAGRRVVLSLAAGAADARRWLAETGLGGGPGEVLVLSGPEGGLTGDEEVAAAAVGFEPVRLGPRTLRADTAPLAWLALSL